MRYVDAVAKREVGYIRIVSGSHLQATCLNGGHKGCRLWLTVGLPGEGPTAGVCDVVKWLASGHKVSQQQHAASGYDLKLVWGMKPRGPRP